MAQILIIDDDKSFREALAESVRDFGHDVVEASGAQEAFKLIGNVDAAFLDLKGERQKVGGRAIRGSLERWLKQSASNA
jgi:CheY-like chemotaxis protein